MEPEKIYQPDIEAQYLAAILDFSKLTFRQRLTTIWGLLTKRCMRLDGAVIRRVTVEYLTLKAGP
jgi:hypothetical protein